MMDVLDAPLVLTKLRPPPARPRIIPRARLIEQLFLDNHRGLFLVRAPAGYGKTTLLAEWSRSLVEQGAAVAWYALDSGDDDPFSFGEYLAASLMHALGPLPELARAVQMLWASPEIHLLRILPAVINAVLAARHNCVLVLDDYHLIHEAEIHQAVSYLLEHLPENLWIAVGSRSDPPLGLARLRARGKILEINASTLRFTREEAARFFNEVMQLNLPPDGIAALEERTEGWIAGLQLAALSLSGSSDRDSFNTFYAGEHRFLVEYLMEEVFLRLPEAVQSFILNTSILERMCPPLCCAVLQAVSSGAEPPQVGGCEDILSELEVANLFIVAMDDAGYWYRYHHLFRDFLQSRLKKTASRRIADLHRAACQWLAQNGFLREAAGHAFKTRDWDYAAAFVERHAFTMIIHSDISTMHEWCSAFPEHVMLAHPMLFVLQCWAWVFTFRQENRARVHSRLLQAEQAAAAIGDEGLIRDLSEHAAVVRSFLFMTPDPSADPLKLIAQAEKTLSGMPDSSPEQFSSLLALGYAHLARSDAGSASAAFLKARQIAVREGLFFGVIESTFHLARTAQAQGRFDDALELCAQARSAISAAISHPEQDLPALGILDVVTALGWIEQNRLDEAGQILARGIDRAGWSTNHFYLFTAYAALYHLNQYLGRREEALKYLDLLETTWPDIEFCTRGLRAVSALRLQPGDPLALENARAWLDKYTPDERNAAPGMGPFGAAEVFYIASNARAEALIAAGRCAEARAYLLRQLSVSAAAGLSARRIETHILLALCAEAEGSREQALEWLGRAVDLAQPAGFLRIFDRGKSMALLLEDAHQRGRWGGDYLRRILAAVTPSAGSHPPEPAPPHLPLQPAHPTSAQPVESISQRELEVLRLIARGATNQAIASDLVITVGTVKSHINHILTKLDARNRTEAAARARELGLF